MKLKLIIVCAFVSGALSAPPLQHTEPDYNLYFAIMTADPAKAQQALTEDARPDANQIWDWGVIDNFTLAQIMVAVNKRLLHAGKTTKQHTKKSIAVLELIVKHLINEYKEMLSLEHNKYNARYKMNQECLAQILPSLENSDALLEKEMPEIATEQTTNPERIFSSAILLGDKELVARTLAAGADVNTYEVINIASLMVVIQAHTMVTNASTVLTQAARDAVEIKNMILLAHVKKLPAQELKAFEETKNAQSMKLSIDEYYKLVIKNITSQ